jgi:hypothetical protein
MECVDICLSFEWIGVEALRVRRERARLPLTWEE